jgi:Flp pilus assembly protein TadG
MQIGERSAGRRGGAAATELALLLPVLVLVVLGCVDFGRFAYNYIAVTNAARAGASYGAMNNYTASTQPTWVAGIKQTARDEMSQQVGSGNISNLQVTVTPITDANGLHRVRVAASYPFTTVVTWNFGGLGLPHTLNLQQQAEMRLIR